MTDPSILHGEAVDVSDDSILVRIDGVATWHSPDNVWPARWRYEPRGEAMSARRAS